MGQIVAVISGKGGTGKTSVCAAVAVCLALENRRVLCLDLDMGLRNLDIALGMENESPIPFTSVMRGEYALSQAPCHPSRENLQLLTAPVLESPDSVSPEAFFAWLGSLRQTYDFILIDSPAGVGSGFRLAVGCADEAMLVTHCDPGSVRDAARTAELLRQYPALRARLIMNRVSKRLFSRMQTTIDDVMDAVGLPLLGVVPEDESVPLAAAAGKPLVEYTYQGAALAALHLAKRLCSERVPLMRL